MNKDAGFTLIEILIALFIFAIVAVVATVILTSVLSSEADMKSQTRGLSQIQLATILMKRDLTQLVNRPIRSANGNTIQAFVASPHYIEFTRTGNVNPFGYLQQSTLKRVAYAIRDHKLVRITWQRLDRVNNTQSSQRVLLTGVISGEFKFLGEKQTFYANWPPATLIDTFGMERTIFPRAVEINLKLKRWGHYQLLIAIPGSAI